MFILSKIWTLIKMFWVELSKEPANNVLDTDIPPDEPPEDQEPSN